MLSRRKEDRAQAEYQERLRTVRPAVDLKAPFSLLGRPRLKRGQEERYSEIERENRHLLQRMASILHSPRDRTLSLQHRSLNRGLRRRELVKITQENHALLRRIREKQSQYSLQKWEKEHASTHGIMKNICEYPLAVPGRRNLPSASKLPPLSSDHQRKLVLKRSVSLGDKSFQLEVRERRGAVSITAFDIERPESYSLQLTRAEATELVGKEKDYKRLVALLHFQQGALMLVEKGRKRRKPVYGEERSRSEARNTPVSGSHQRIEGNDKENKWSAGRIRSLSEKRIVKRRKEGSRAPVLQPKTSTPQTSKPSETTASAHCEDQYEDSFEAEDSVYS